MCDYSLMAMPNRLAERGEELVLYRFPTGSMGFGPPLKVKGLWDAMKAFFNPASPSIAICIPPGAQLELRNIPFSLQVALGVKERERVTFTEISETGNSYRDAVTFPTGDAVLLQRLPPNEHARVLELSPATPAASEELHEELSLLKAA